MSEDHSTVRNTRRRERQRRNNQRYYEKNRQEELKRNKDWRRKNPDKLKAIKAREYQKNKEKYLARSKKNHDKNPYSILDSLEKRRRERVAYLRKLRKEGCCKRCGFKDWRCLEFHHRDPLTKIANVVVMASRRLDVFLREIAKCDLICANCHRIEHYDAKHGPTILRKKRCRQLEIPFDETVHRQGSEATTQLE